MNSWIFLLGAGCFEIAFTTCMKLSNSFTVTIYNIGFMICVITSFLLLNKALEHVPLGTAYAVWTGIGAFGTATIGMIFFKDPVSTIRIMLLLILMSSIVGLNLIAPK